MIKDLRRGTRVRRRPTRPTLLDLERRALLAPLNVLVDNPALDTGAQKTHSETSVLAFTGQGGVPIVLDSFNSSALYNGSASGHFTGYARSTDGGATFTDLSPLPTNASGDFGDPVLARDNVSGRIYLTTLSSGNPIQVFRSDTDGLTFQAPVNGAPGRTSTDKEWITVDNAAGPGQGTVYLVVRDFGTGNGIYLYKSTDAGTTWGPTGGVLIASGAATNVQGANITVGPDHAVYASYFNQTSPQAIQTRKSTDGGVTFGPAVTISTLSTTGTNGDQGLSPGFRSDAFPQLTVDPANASIVFAVYPDRVNSPADKGNIYFSESTNGGATWGPRVQVNTDTGTNDQYMPTLAVTPDGSKVGVFWYDRRNDPANNLIDYFGSIGSISGTTVTFGPNYKITDASFRPIFGLDPVVNGVYMGDYDQASTNGTSFYMTHVDTRLGAQDVFFSKISTAAVGPEVINVVPGVSAAPGLTSVRVTFNEPINLATIGTTDFALAGPRSDVRLTGLTPVAGTNNTQFDVSFAALGRTGNYTFYVLPQRIADLGGHLLDNNVDGIGGDPVGDLFTSTFRITGPQVIASSPTGQTPSPVSDAFVTFNEPMNPATFTASQVTIVGPGGAITPISITPVTGTNNTQFDIHFAPQAAGGAYQITVGPNILDTFGNKMDQNNNGIPGETPGDQFVLNFSIFQIVNYVATAVPINFVQLANDPAAFNIITSADDSSVPVNLGTNTFNFYNSIYTGNNQLFASSNALLSFLSANAEFTNANLTTDPTQAAIAPLWDDWIGSSVNTAANPMVLGKFTTFAGAPALVIEWNQIWHFSSSPSTITFEAILTLNTGTTQGNIYFEYLNLASGDTNANGASATTGIKDVGTQPATGGNSLLVNFNNGANPLVQTGTAIKLSVNGTSPGTAVQWNDPFAQPVVEETKFYDGPLLGGDDSNDGGSPGTGALSGGGSGGGTSDGNGPPIGNFSVGRVVPTPPKGGGDAPAASTPIPLFPPSAVATTTTTDPAPTPADTAPTLPADAVDQVITQSAEQPLEDWIGSLIARKRRPNV